ELDRNIISALRDEVIMRQECNVVSVGTPNYKRLVNMAQAVRMKLCRLVV
ncbi:hypothetical protein ISO76_19090, partial [Morganella morganii subsp. morganii]|nr:hypothetical protein [Morganella morganii subsp. morganii]